MNSAASAALRAAKEALRGEVKKKLLSMSKDEKLKQSRLIADKLINHDRFKNSHRISIYLSTDHEVHTVGILEQIFKMDKQCFIPKYDLNNQHMDMVRLYSLEDLAKLPLTKWNIKQPSDDDHREEALATGGLDLMVIPGLAFDKRGGRIGTGQGYYDVYIDRCLHDPSGRPYLVGLAFQEQILHSIPMDEHDIVADDVVFPDNTSEV
ncbi:5-formyltetrahydrofolate cyclo-ligase-like [Limulus polyphemus]|uniref:5-formyltetrahydrofolate cyclo-ligase n=1 Tax=Limulus polyphemus TaxID=6850 RepID=A0ABM1BUL3_LIMPO|nr:5-formyltetrahydrofolate cyclo-ligase-like [Limulus polyphemus]